jgi:hypothetical protein
MRNHKRRSILFHTLTCLAIVATAAWITEERVRPLSAPPEAPPPGLHLAWAGQSIRGYVESVSTYVKGCRKPEHVSMVLYPPVSYPAAERHWKPPAAGPVAFAIFGNSTQITLRDARISFSNKLGYPLAYLPGPVTFTPPGQGRDKAIVVKFMLHPAKRRNIEISFEADWTFPRTGQDSCWLNLPSLMGPNAAVGAANKAIGHPGWTEDQLGAPLYSAANYLHDAQSAVRVDASNSIPLPSELEEPSWGCVKEAEGGHECEAFASLELPGTEASRTRELARWNLADGLLLGFLIGLLLEIGHLVLSIGRFASRS